MVRKSAHAEPRRSRRIISAYSAPPREAILHESLLLQPRNPLGDRRIVWQQLARLFQPCQRLVVAVEDEENLYAKLDEALVEVKVGHGLRRQQRQGAVDELESHLGF